ncbi:MAG: hypothetical protein IKH33_04070 [Bacteroidales bacterium]|nr:hypothetical protein [Bacteroidales bacterium]
MNKLLNNILKTVIQLIVLLFVATGSEANAQYPYNFSYAGLPLSTTSIVRHFDEQRAVVYYEEGGRGYVSLVNVVSNTTSTVPLDAGYLMNDMCIMNDSVFLCGQYINSTTHYGCIVTMNLNAFGSGSVLTTYFQPSYWVRMNLKRIKGFEYTYSSGLQRAKFLLVADIEYACDGSEPFPLYYFSHKYTYPGDPSMCTVNAVLEESYPFTVTGSYGTTQKVLRVTSPYDHIEIIHDVVVTDNYVAFVGLQVDSLYKITLHICDKGINILSSNYSAVPPQLSDFDNYYVYPLGKNIGNPFYRACALGGDKIAIVTQDEMNTATNEITVRTIDLVTHTMTYSQELYCLSHPDLKDIAYIPDLQKLVLLQHSFFRPTSSYEDIFCLVDPLATSSSYSLPGITDNVYHYKHGSLDAMKHSYFISTGGKYGFVSDAGNFSTGNICYNMDSFNIKKIASIDVVTEPFDYDQYLPYPTIQHVDEVSSHLQIPLHCRE